MFRLQLLVDSMQHVLCSLQETIRELDHVRLGSSAAVAGWVTKVDVHLVRDLVTGLEDQLQVLRNNSCLGGLEAEGPYGLA